MDVQMLASPYYRAPKRKRGLSEITRRRQAAITKRKLSQMVAMPGFTRTTGFYGRYAPGTGELKFHDVAVDDAVVPTAGAILDSINLIPQGVTEKTRVGRKCVIRSINWRFNYSLPAQADQADIGTGETIRIIMFLDKQCNGATATVLGILETADYQSFNNLANKGRFRTLMDRTYPLNRINSVTDGASTSSSALLTYCDTFFKKVNIPIEFDNTTGAITEIRSNNVGVLFITQAGVAGFNSNVRVRFSDN